MAELVELDGHGPVCLDCVHGCPRPPGHPVCERDGCRCPCRDRDDGRARDLDDRPYEALVSIARDLEAEARPNVRDLVAERYGRPTRGRA